MIILESIAKAKRLREEQEQQTGSAEPAAQRPPARGKVADTVTAPVSRLEFPRLPVDASV